MPPHIPPLPTSSRASPAQAARSDAEALAAILRLARALAERGKDLDLAGLDQQVGRLCAGALDLPPADGRALRADLVALHQEIELLSQALRNQAVAGGAQ